MAERPQARLESEIRNRSLAYSDYSPGHGGLV